MDGFKIFMLQLEAKLMSCELLKVNLFHLIREQIQLPGFYLTVHKQDVHLGLRYSGPEGSAQQKIHKNTNTYMGHTLTFML